MRQIRIIPEMLVADTIGLEGNELRSGTWRSQSPGRSWFRSAGQTTMPPAAALGSRHQRRSREKAIILSAWPTAVVAHTAGHRVSTARTRRRAGSYIQIM